MNYNTSQQQAIRHKDGPMLVLAGPGSGKTAVITGRTQYLIEQEHVKPADILVITFTRAAAAEMKQRFERLNGGRSDVTFGTFHAVFFSILKSAYHYDSRNIITLDQKYRFMRDILSRHKLEYQDESEYISELLAEISMIKNSRISVEGYTSRNCGGDVFPLIYREYENRMRKNRLIDYDDMLTYTYELFCERKDILSQWQRRFRYFMIDEFQDINRIQYDIMRMLAAPGNNLFIVGDDDQSIYGFRGSMPEIMLHFTRDYPKAETLLLDVNYRCGRYILETSLNLISHNRVRFPKQIRSSRRLQKPVVYASFENKKAECEYIMEEIKRLSGEERDYSSCAVLFRTNTQQGMLCELLLSADIPFTMRDGVTNIYEHWIARDLFTYMDLAAGSRAREDFLRILNRPNRFLERDSLQDSRVSFEKWMKYYEDRDWMKERIYKLQTDLNMLKKLSPYGAVNYIRKGIGYDHYLESLAISKGLDRYTFVEIADEILSHAAGFKNYESWQEHIREYTGKMKLIAANKERKREGVLLSTLHSAKGLEFDHVFLPDVNEGVMPYKKAQEEKEIEEERRLFYVGMTRARKSLYLCCLKQSGDKKMQPSRFLSESKKAAVHVGRSAENKAGEY